MRRPFLLLAMGAVASAACDPVDLLHPGQPPQQPPGTAKPVGLALGSEDTCALLQDDTVNCWGGDRPARAVSLAGPVRTVSRSRPAVYSLPPGARPTCVLLSDGRVQCWGYYAPNYDFEPEGGTQDAPYMVDGLGEPAVGVVSGGFHSCAVLESGGVACWGDNSSGQLGAGGPDGGTPVPVFIQGLRGPVTQLALGMQHTCALLASGEVDCWGDNQVCQLGDNTSESRAVATPVVQLGGRVLQISSGEHHTCALVEGGTPQCWGHNRAGELGNNLPGVSCVPSSVVQLGGRAVQIAAGGALTCVLLDDGAVKCWGVNSKGQVGAGLFSESEPLPRSVAVEGTVVQVAAGTAHACALMENGPISCWGDNSHWQMGKNVLIGSNRSPVVVNYE